MPLTGLGIILNYKTKMDYVNNNVFSIKNTISTPSSSMQIVKQQIL